MHFIPSKSVELKVCECSPLRFVTFGGSRGIQLDSLAVRPTAIHDNKIWKIVYEIRRDGIGGT